MELVLQSYLGSCVQLYLLAETPQLPPPPAFGLIYEGAIGQPRETTSLCNPLELDHEQFPLTKTSMTSLRVRLEKEAVSWVPRC
jgi:hypothetical protein